MAESEITTAVAFHDAANIFPLLDGDEFAALKADIAANGLLEPIRMYRGKILDGRNRYRACMELGIEPDSIEVHTSSPVEYVVSLNLHRRHLEQGQRAVCSLEAEKLIAAELEEERRSKISHFRTTGETIEKIQESQTAAQIAGDMFRVNPHYVADAKKLQQKAPDLLEQVRTGEMKIPEAKRELRKREVAETIQQRIEEKKANPTPLIPPSLVLADPPWRYDFATANREVENHYPTATIEEIIGHAPLTQRDCVLLLWATVALLPEAMTVMEAWGFSYKTHAVWDKEKMGMGYWFRGQHELLLVGTKGSASPPEPEHRVASVFREARGEHSVKPMCVYEWIESAFPIADKLEMYCRQPREGWMAWGNMV